MARGKESWEGGRPNLQACIKPARSRNGLGLEGARSAPQVALDLVGTLKTLVLIGCIAAVAIQTRCGTAEIVGEDTTEETDRGDLNSGKIERQQPITPIRQSGMPAEIDGGSAVGMPEETAQKVFSDE